MRLHYIGKPFRRSFYLYFGPEMLNISVYAFKRNFYYYRLRGNLKAMFGPSIRKGVLYYSPLDRNPFFEGAW